MTRRSKQSGGFCGYHLTAVSRGAADRLSEVERVLGVCGCSYLVGSAVWPGSWGVADRDYVTNAQPQAVAQWISHQLTTRAVLMDPERQHWRIVGPSLPVLDLAPMFGGDIAQDLSRRDFTINAMAAMLPNRRPVLDPFRGRADLRHGLIRQVSSQSMAADPIRVLRGLRLASEHGFVIERKTLQSMCRAAQALGTTKPERIRAELLRGLQAAGWRRMASDALRLGVWAGLPVRPRLDPCSARLAAYLNSLENLEALAAAATSHLGGIPGLSQQRARAVAVLAAVLRASDLTTSGTHLGRRLRLSAREGAALAGMEASALAVPDLDAADLGQVYRLVEEHGPAAAWGAAINGARPVLEAMLRLRLSEAARLPDGRELAAALARTPGPWLGALLRRLRYQVATGKIAPSQALQVAADWLRDSAMGSDRSDGG